MTGLAQARSLNEGEERHPIKHHLCFRHTDARQDAWGMYGLYTGLPQGSGEQGPGKVATGKQILCDPPPHLSLGIHKGFWVALQVEEADSSPPQPWGPERLVGVWVSAQLLGIVQ